MQHHLKNFFCEIFYNVYYNNNKTSFNKLDTIIHKSIV